MAALALRRLFPGKALQVDDVRRLINRSVLDGADEVRSEAARALRSVGDPSVTAPALRALSSTNPRLRENSIQALGSWVPRVGGTLDDHLGNVHSAVQAGRTSAAASSYLFVGTQTAYVQDFDVEWRSSPRVADPQINTVIEGSVLDARVLGCYALSFATETRLFSARPPPRAERRPPPGS
ncbi:MAG: HEAT repeat domain-containing protein [Planctomycetes bacterium]|nr:HEAT repeat domain-containing protein [Planctomycetota bacterium]